MVDGTAVITGACASGCCANVLTGKCELKLLYLIDSRSRTKIGFARVSSVAVLVRGDREGQLSHGAMQLPVLRLAAS